MRYVITGAGMLGSALAERLRGEAHTVVLVDRVPAPGVVEVDLRDRAAVGAVLEHADGVFHTAAVHGFREASDLEFFEVNVGGTWTLLDAMSDAGVPRLVHSSTIGVYGEGGRRVIGPDTPPGPASSPYNESKRIAEEVVRYFGARRGMHTVCLRYGAFRELLERTFGGIPGDWAASGAVVGLDDVVQATVAAMERLPLPRAAYVVAPSGSGTAYRIDASATEADLGVSVRPFAG